LQCTTQRRSDSPFFSKRKKTQSRTKRLSGPPERAIRTDHVVSDKKAQSTEKSPISSGFIAMSTKSLSLFSAMIANNEKITTRINKKHTKKKTIISKKSKRLYFLPFFHPNVII